MIAGVHRMASRGEPKISMEPDALATWFERLGGGQLVTETLMGINQQPQLSSHRLRTCGPIDNQRLRRSVEVSGCGLNAGIPFNQTHELYQLQLQAVQSRFSASLLDHPHDRVKPAEHLVDGILKCRFRHGYHLQTSSRGSHLVEG
jgi:hypothetical protein